MQNIIRFINAIILGYVLTFSGLILNYLDDNKVGVFAALLAFGVGYIHESAIFHPRFAWTDNLFYAMSFTATLTSLLIYLFN